MKNSLRIHPNFVQNLFGIVIEYYFKKLFSNHFMQRITTGFLAEFLFKIPHEFCGQNFIRISV